MPFRTPSVRSFLASTLNSPCKSPSPETKPPLKSSGFANPGPKSRALHPRKPFAPPAKKDRSNGIPLKFAPFTAQPPRNRPCQEVPICWLLFPLPYPLSFRAEIMGKGNVAQRAIGPIRWKPNSDYLPSASNPQPVHSAWMRKEPPTLGLTDQSVLQSTRDKIDA